MYVFYDLNRSPWKWRSEEMRHCDIEALRLDKAVRFCGVPRDVTEIISQYVSAPFTPRRFRRWKRRAAALRYYRLPNLFPGLVLSGYAHIKYYAKHKVMVATATCVYFYQKTSGVPYALVGKHPFGSEIDIVLYVGLEQFILLTVHCRAFHVDITGVRYRGDCSYFSTMESLRILPSGALFDGAEVALPETGYVVDDNGEIIHHDLSPEAFALSWASGECLEVRD